jgi:DNA-binding transcriptional ArsR family regulator
LVRIKSGLTLFRYLAKYQLMNQVFKALADPTRRTVLQLLRQRPMTAGELSNHFPVSRPTMSAHFVVLREAGLIGASKQGTTITYRLQLSVLEDALLGFSQALGIGGALEHPQPITPGPNKGQST